MKHRARYVLSSSDSGMFAEIYFPKRSAYQGAIFDALRNGFFEKEVKEYLSANAADLIEELRDWSEILDPLKYSAEQPLFRTLTSQDVLQRIQMYRSVFKGYSMYSVDGFFFSDATQQIYEEPTQIVRLIFRFESKLAAQAEIEGCKDMLRCLLFWLVDYVMRLDHHFSWAPSEREHFLHDHKHWPAAQLAFAERHFADLAREAEQWLDDCGLFIFGYLVRKFSKNVLAQNMNEEEIWVVGSYEACMNVVKRVMPG